MHKDYLRTLPLKSVRIDDSFWNNYIGLVEEVILPFMWELINDRVEGAEKSYCIHNFQVAAGDIEGTHQGMVFQDTDVAKWLEAAAFALAKKHDPELEKTADWAIDLIGRAQEEDGYLDTYFTITGTPKWSDLMEGHELYTSGHMIEAAVAYYEATGKRKFLDIMIRNADCIDRTFGHEAGKLPGYPGHPEIELALMKLYRVTGCERYLHLAEYFVRERGAEPNYFVGERTREGFKYIFPEFVDFDLAYQQADRPLSEQTEAEGHAVRAAYLYSGMADLAAELRDDKLFRQCELLWNDITEKKMYITGSIGSAAFGERFTSKYDLPNDTNYSESCASIALAMFGDRMFRCTHDGKYMDVVELALYNTVLAGIALDGKHFYYVNPLSSNPPVTEHNPTCKHVKTERQQWFGCACCPPNIARTLASMGGYMVNVNEDTVWVNLFIRSTVEAEFPEGGKMTIALEADYPRSGHMVFRLSGISEAGRRVKLALRKPAAAHWYGLLINGTNPEANQANVSVSYDKGYLYLEKEWKDGDVIEYDLDTEFRFVYCNPRVAADIGKVALMKGPWVYCLEEADNGKHLAAFYANPEAEMTAVTAKGMPEGIPAAEFEGWKLVIPDEDAPLYTELRPQYEKTVIRAVPYCMWNNRGKGEMLVWMQVKP